MLISGMFHINTCTFYIGNTCCITVLNFSFRFGTSTLNFSSVSDSKDLPSGEDDGSTPWPPISESTSKHDVCVCVFVCYLE